VIEILFLINYLKRLIRVFVLELRDRTESKDGEFKDRITDVEVLCPICQVEFDQFVFDNIVITCKITYFRKKLVISMIW